MNFSALFGLAGSILLGIPALRMELYRRKYHRFKVANQAVSEVHGDLEKKLARVIENRTIQLLVLSWSALDSACIFLGLSALAVSFCIELF